VLPSRAMTTDIRIAAITGGAGALGSALAQTLVAKGYKVALFDTERATGRLAELVKELGPSNAFAHASDFASAASWTAALDATEAALGGRPTHGALIAGGWAGGAPVHEAKDESVYERMMGSNVDTVYRALRALLPAMVDAQHGSIVVIGSRAVERPWTSSGAAAYAASKAAAVTLAQAVAAEVRDDGVRINAILPSTMDTPANRASTPNEDPSKWVSLPSAAGVIAFLLSDDARDVSGAVIPVYGRA
jgi:NAD(P)-dependent dehydrogenase (short-subunit alcohol dehydrogenase family)